MPTTKLSASKEEKEKFTAHDYSTPAPSCFDIHRIRNLNNRIKISEDAGEFRCVNRDGETISFEGNLI